MECPCYGKAGCRKKSLLSPSSPARSPTSASASAILFRPLSRYGLWAALIISLTYFVIGTALVPRLWADPLGPMLKIWPVLMLNLVAMAIREDR
ncbi:DoxX-like family protein [Bradyrhizobium sp. 169]|uniref:DoxX-like family protein n=1 Tax=Bradyrhizobium sp. 169 TaxID=2782640 RepID=UPI0031F6721B